MSKGRFKQLEDTFNIDSQIDPDEFENDEQATGVPSPEDLSEALSQAKNLERQFSKMDHYDTHDREMDELAQLAIDAHKNLQDLGMNVEIRHAGEIFSSSSQMLKIAVDAKNNKVEKKLRLLKLQMDKLKLDRQFKEGDAVDGTAVKLDRNELLRQIREMGKDDPK